MGKRIFPNKANQYDDERIGRSKAVRQTIGVLIEHTMDLDHGYQPVLLNGIIAAARNHDVNLLCFVGGALRGKPLVEFDAQRNVLYELASSENLDGLIVFSTIGHHVPPEEFKKFFARYHPLPTVSIGAKLAGVPCVVTNNEKGLRDGLVHLIEEHNYQRIAFIQGPEDSVEAQLRYRVYKEVLAVHDLPLDPNLVAPGSFRFAAGAEAIRILLDQRQMSFDALVAANDNMALGALEELHVRNISVPHDVAVIGFDDIEQAKMALPSLTTVRQPIFEMGRQAVEMLIANEPLPATIELPTELVLRRSCGCIDPSDTRILQKPETVSKKTTSQFFQARQKAILADLAHVATASKIIAPELKEELLVSFVTDLSGGSERNFLSLLDRVLPRDMKDEIDIQVWQEVVSVLRHHTSSAPINDDVLLRAEVLLNKAQALIVEVGQKVLIKQNVLMERQNILLHEINQSLVATFDLEKLLDILAEGTFDLGIQSCYLALYEDIRPYIYPQPPPEWSTLVLARIQKKRIEFESNGQRFRSQELLPKEFLPQNRAYIMMVEPLFFEEEQIGFALFERGPQKGNIYEILRGQICSALKGALLLQAHQQAEEELRQHRDHLDELVQGRTRELASVNEHLRQEIEERKRVEMALRESEENLYATLHSIGDAVIATDTKSCIVRMNPIAEKLTGWTFGEAKGRPLAEVFNIVNAYTRETAVSPVQKVLENGETVGLANHTMLVAKDQTIYQIADSAAPIRDYQQEITGVVLVFRDVTEEYRMQAALQESRQMLENVINTIPVRVFWKDLKGVFSGCNLLFAQDAGKNSPKEVIGLDDYSFNWAAQADLYRSDDQRVIKTGQPKINYEEPQTTPQGEVIWLNTSKIPLRDSSGEIFGVLGTYEDITERKRAEQVLKESKERLQLALHAASMGTWEWDIANNYVQWSPEMFEIFEISQDMFGETYEDYLKHVHPISRQNIDEMVQEFVHEANESSIIVFEHEIIRGDGAIGWVEIRGALFLNDTDEPARMIGICQDVTSRKEMVLQLKANMAELRRSNRELQEFANIASHDLQEPLRKIQTFGDLLQEKYRPDLDEKGLIYLDRMQSAASRMQALIIDLLAFSRVRTQVQPFQRVDLQQIVTHVLQDLEVAITEIEADIKVTELPIIEADSSQMYQLFLNLIDNALKFHRFGVRPSVRITSRIVEKDCKISIADNGIGFEERYAERIFNVFERLHNRGEYTGTGVGLAICRRIVEYHGGNIYSQSKLGEGSTFIVTLPLQQSLNESQ